MVFSMDKDSDGRVNKQGKYFNHFLTLNNFLFDTFIFRIHKADTKQIDQTYKLIKNLDTK